jgi:hypothetical protein
MKKQEGIFKQYGVIGVILISTMLLAMLFQIIVVILGLVYKEFSVFYLVITIISFMTLEMCCMLLLNKESQVFKVFSKIMRIKLKENK